MFSKACEYGIRAAIYIASESLEGNWVSLKDIARKIDSPEAFTAKILQILTGKGIVGSSRGAGGGFYIEKSQMADIKLEQIVQAIDGDKIYNGCGLGLHECNEDHPCPVHFKFRDIRAGLQQMLSKTSLEELAMGISSGETFLKV